MSTAATIPAEALPVEVLDVVELELEALYRDLAAAATRSLDLVRALRAVRASAQHVQAPAPPSPPRPGSAAGEPPASAAEPSAAAPALPSSPPDPRPPAGQTARTAARRERADRERAANRDRVIEAMRRLGYGWHSTGTIAGEAGIGHRAARVAIAELGLESNGKGGPHGRYRHRFPPRTGHAATPLRPPGPAAAAERRAERETDLGKPAGPVQISRRVRRELEREQATEFVDRDDGTGTREGRILEALLTAPAGLRTLARRLGLERPDAELVADLSRMLEAGDVLRVANPDRRTADDETHVYYTPHR